MPSSRINKLLVAGGLCILLFLTVLMLHPPSRVYYIDPWTGSVFGEGGVDSVSSTKSTKGKSPSYDGVSPHDLEMIKGGVIMPKLGNATAKAELGRAAWKLMHTMTLRYPYKPTQDERDALKSYFYLTSRLYPCGECAKEFQELLKKYPPQTSTRQIASLWLCHIHNQVNARLKKPEFDCTKLDETYDCGCGDPPLNSNSKLDPKAGGADAVAALEKEHSEDRKEPTRLDDVTGLDMIKGGAGRRMLS